MKTKHAATIVGLFVMISVFVFSANAALLGNNNVVSNSYNTAATGQAAGQATTTITSSGKQIVQLSMRNGNYYPNTINLKKGVPVEITVDMNSVKGCYRTILIPAFNIRKTLTTSDNKIEFTPDKAGTFGFSCSMGMGTGKIIVQDENGNVPQLDTVATDVPKGGSCGASGGGCGCGGG